MNSLGAGLRDRRVRKGYDRVELFGAGKEVFGIAVELLDLAGRAVAAAGVVLEIVRPDGELKLALEYALKIRVGAGEGELVVAFALHVVHHQVDVVSGRAAAVVSGAVEEHKAVAGIVDALIVKIDLLEDMLSVAAVAGGYAVGKHARAVLAVPPEGILRDIVVFVRFGAHENICVHAALAEKLGEHAVVTEGVNVVAGAADLAELLIVEKRL